MNTPPPIALSPEALQQLFDALRAEGFDVIGPTRREGAIVYDELTSTSELPIGWTEVQEAGTYRLERREDSAYFGYAVGPHAFKRYLFPPKETLWRAVPDETRGFRVESPNTPVPRYAFLGVRACELAAISIQDRVFSGDGFVEPGYAARREAALLIAVNCGVPGGTCFCTSMGTGPAADKGFDIVLTEVLDEEHGHVFLAEAGSQRGVQLLSALGELEPASPTLKEAALDVTRRASEQMGRALETEGLPEVMTSSYEHPRWADVAERCLGCANCTMVCPTCFCHTVDDLTALDGSASRERRWDSCFTLDFSYMHGGAVRSSTRSRYRQWLTHKLGTWWAQFGESGCVGCGRCITWCPVGIDITAEAAALRLTPAPPEEV